VGQTKRSQHPPQAHWPSILEYLGQLRYCFSFFFKLLYCQMSGSNRYVLCDDCALGVCVISTDCASRVCDCGRAAESRD
jgi:hypothetical protein